jgi:hypothetical protein
MGFTPYPFCVPNFQFTDCVGPTACKDFGVHRVVPCFHYQNATGEAWIAVATLLPVTTKNFEDIQADFKFIDGPTSVQLTNPELAVLSRYEDSVKKARSVR